MSYFFNVEMQLVNQYNMVKLYYCYKRNEDSEIREVVDVLYKIRAMKML